MFRVRNMKPAATACREGLTRFFFHEPARADETLMVHQAVAAGAALLGIQHARVGNERRFLEICPSQDPLLDHRSLAHVIGFSEDLKREDARRRV